MLAEFPDPGRLPAMASAVERELSTATATTGDGRVTENPSDYKNGEYDGFAIAYITQNGFIHILFNVNVSSFAGAA